MLVGVAEIVSRGDHPGCGASPRLDSVVVGDVMRFGTNQIVWYDDAAVGMLVPSGPAGGSWVLTNADHVVALVVVLGCCFGGPCNGVTLGFRPTTTAL